MRLSATSTSISSKTIVAASGGGGGGASGETAELTFRYHMYGADMQSYYVYWEVISGGTVGHTQLWSKTGQQHTSTTDQWDLATIDMTSFRGTTGRLKVVALLSPNTAFKNDAAFLRFIITRSDAGSTNWMYTNAGGAVRTHGASSAVVSSNPVDALTINSPNTLNGSNNSNGTWGVTSGATPSVDTGPDKHYNDGSGNTYLYFESSGASDTSAKVYLAENVSTITI